MSEKRYVIECIWSGYPSSQSKPCHRMITTRPKRYKGITSIKFGDGTYMTVTLRPAKLREKIEKIDGYSRLLDRAWISGLKGSISVDEI